MHIIFLVSTAIFPGTFYLSPEGVIQFGGLAAAAVAAQEGMDMLAYIHSKLRIVHAPILKQTHQECNKLSRIYSVFRSIDLASRFFERSL